MLLISTITCGNLQMCTVSVIKFYKQTVSAVVGKHPLCPVTSRMFPFTAACVFTLNTDVNECIDMSDASEL